MKNLSEQMVNFDRENFRRAAHGMPEVQDEQTQVEQVAQVINGVFSQLFATFPAATANRNQDDLNELRRQWVLAFRENGITTMKQIAAGMRVARRQEKPFLPSPGQFVAWCKQEVRAFGITADDVMAEYWQWRKLVFKYPSSESYPWPQPVLYHICLELRRLSTDGQLSGKEINQAAADQLAYWEERAASGQPVPPVRRAIAAPKAGKGPTPAELLLAQYNRNKSNGMV
jgi:hypothetical protein